MNSDDELRLEGVVFSSWLINSVKSDMTSLRCFYLRSRGYSRAGPLDLPSFECDLQNVDSAIASE